MIISYALLVLAVVFVPKIEKHQINIIVDSDNKILNALDVARFVFEKAKNIEIIRTMHPEFFYMFEADEKQVLKVEQNDFER